MHCGLQIIVPMPSFDSQTKKPWAKTPKEKEKVSVHLHHMAMVGQQFAELA